MRNPEINKRSRREPAPRQFVAEVTYDPADKHNIKCDCLMCRCAWAGMTIEKWNNNGEARS
jgi:hypothetical protein